MVQTADLRQADDVTQAGRLTVDPHGHAIPEKDGAVAQREEITLAQWHCGVPAVISSVSDRDPRALREMQRLGLMPGTRLRVESGTRNASLLISVGGKPPSRISLELTTAIFVLGEPPPGESGVE